MFGYSLIFARPEGHDDAKGETARPRDRKPTS
jgi:hypothetical protein